MRTHTKKYDKKQKKGGGMLITLRRTLYTANGTIGRIDIDGKEICRSIEPNRGWGTYRERSGQKSDKGCIPQGWYGVTISESPKFGRELPILMDVPGFERIRIHAGNTYKHTAGCILPGELCMPENYYREKENAVPTVFESRKREGELTKIIKSALKKGEYVYIRITEETN